MILFIASTLVIRKSTLFSMEPLGMSDSFMTGTCTNCTCLPAMLEDGSPLAIMLFGLQLMSGCLCLFADLVEYLCSLLLGDLLCCVCGIIRLTSNVWAGYSPRLLRARYAPATRRRFTCVVLPRRGGIYSTSQVTR